MGATMLAAEKIQEKGDGLRTTLDCMNEVHVARSTLDELKFTERADKDSK